MDGGRPQSAPTQRPPAAQRPLTAPATRTGLKNLEGQKVRFSDGQGVEFSEGAQNSFWALQETEQKNDSQVHARADSASKSETLSSPLKLALQLPEILSSESVLHHEKHKFAEHPSTIENMQTSEKKVSFKSLHLEKAAIDDYRGRQQHMALKCVTSLEGWEETKNKLIANIQSVISPEITLTDKARKTVLNSLLSNFFALLHVPSFKVEHLNLEIELQSKVPSFLLQLQKDVQERQGRENTVDLNERETKQGILGTYGKQFMIEAFINGVSLARQDEESNLIVKRAALNEEFRKLQVMRKELESASAVYAGQRSKLEDLGVQLKSKDQRIDDLERQIRRRDESHADQVANLLKEIHALKTNYSKATSIAQATTQGIQNALMASAKQQHPVEMSPMGTFMIDSAKIQSLDFEQKKIFQAEHNKMLAAHEKRIHVLEDALCNAQANLLSDSLTHRRSLAAMISWASSTLKFEEDLHAVFEKVFCADAPVSSAALAISGKQLTQPHSNEKLASLLALTQEISKVSIEISKISTQKLSKFYKLLQFASDLLSFIDNGNLVLPKEMESQKKDLFPRDVSTGSDDVIMFPEGYKVQIPMSSEDAELNRILAKDRKSFRNSLFDLLLEFQKKSIESQKTSKSKQDLGQDFKNISKNSHDVGMDKETNRRDFHDSPKTDQTKSKFKTAAVAMQLQSLSSSVTSPKMQSLSPAAIVEPLVIASSVRTLSLHDDQSVAGLTKQRDDYMVRLSTLSAEMTQLQITMQDIQRQRAEMSAKTSEDFDEMVTTIHDLKKEKEAVLLQTNQKYATMAATMSELKQERDDLRNQLQRHFHDHAATHTDDYLAPEPISRQNEKSQPEGLYDKLQAPKVLVVHATEHVAIPALNLSLLNLQTESNSAVRHKTDASCQTIEEWQTTKIVQLEMKSNDDRINESGGIIESTTNSKKPVSKLENVLDLNTVTPAAQMIFDATNRNVQANFSNQRPPVFDEFNETARTNTQNNMRIPNIDLSRAFLVSVGESEVHHFQQNSTYLPRFQKVAMKQMPSQPRMTKKDETFIAEISPNSNPISIRGQKPSMTVAVLEIPNRFDIPASHFSQPPYTSRPTTSKHSDLFISADIRPETARPPNRIIRPKPQRPTSARCTDGNVSKRSAKIMRAVSYSYDNVAAPSSPNFQQHVASGKKDGHHVDCLNVEESSGIEIGTHSSILTEYLNGISVGQPS